MTAARPQRPDLMPSFQSRASREGLPYGQSTNQPGTIDHGWLVEANDSFGGAEAAAREAAARAMAERGIDNPSELLTLATPIAILRACKWFDSQPASATPGALAKVIRQGGMPEQRAPRKHHDADYLANIARWIAAKLPDLCTPDQRVVEWDRKVYGEASANELARSTSPHPAAIVAVVHLHHRYGRGSLTVREHGPQIRAAVRAANERAIADYQHLAKRRAEG